MRSRQAVLVVAALVCVGCTAGPTATPPTATPPTATPLTATPLTATPPTATPPTATPALPGLAGPGEAAVVGTLPTGIADGSVVVSYAGLGEVRAPMSGTCAHAGARTTVRGSADGAAVELAFGPEGAVLTLDDVGLRSTAAVAAGDLAVDGVRLHLTAPLVADGQVIGDVDLDVTCTG
ncbi:hypothetical protein [Geodermatophilus sp. DSM 44513]|uniref:hypothetical protein n=1 Tax=Geodermatophilus sp. DSM 44513 TaxID=1528104 RepID=UPI0028F7131C|nr:hypothetical protein [Geodermatophilus sp. DSM 44513]WNV74825.1 hypothetical protein RTG05_17775 [Geodermatophilus sp. DSM 44513]